MSLLEINQDPIWNVLVRFFTNIVVLIIVIRFIYSRYSKSTKNVFSFFQMGIMIFLVCILLQHVEIQLGVAMGLFAVFAILRFRSEGLQLREMTYFFTVIGVAVVNAMAHFYNPVRGPIIVNLLIIIPLYILEQLYHKKPKKSDNSAIVLYDRLELLGKDRSDELLKDLSARTFKTIKRADIRKIDLSKGNVELEIFF